MDYEELQAAAEEQGPGAQRSEADWRLIGRHARNNRDAAALSLQMSGTIPTEEEATVPERTVLDARRNALVRSKQALMTQIRGMDWYGLPVLGLWYVALARVRVEAADACDRLGQIEKMARERGLQELARDLDSLRGSVLLFQCARDRARF